MIPRQMSRVLRLGVVAASATAICGAGVTRNDNDSPKKASTGIVEPVCAPACGKQPRCHQKSHWASSCMQDCRDFRALHPQVFVLDNIVTRSLLTVLRDKSTDHVTFVSHSDRLMTILVEWALAAASVKPKVVTTPCGDVLLEATRRVAPAVATGKILIQRDESSPTKAPKLFYVKLPSDIAAKTVFLVDPMLATGGSATMAIRELINSGVKEESIVFVNVVSCPEGLRRMAKDYPAVRIITAALDEKLNEHMFIVPGIGDFGDRCGDRPSLIDTSFRISDLRP